ncbi:MAG: ribosome small subunit-dependent GTPase A [Woeseiaceae bacterium]|nr:ribosome small subunit-dependent GTPase A [Woeseiaceae bacterium]
MTNVSEQPGLVTATFSQRMRLRLDDGREVTGRLKGKKLRPVCGDRIEARAIPNEPEWLVTAILPRRNELTRPDKRGQVEVLAANIGLIAAVTSDRPATDWYIVDRYVAAAELMGASAVIVFNKTDLAPASGSSEAELGVFTNIGYTTIRCSAKSGENIDQLRRALHHSTSIIVGQSGVGKSSLINALVEGADQDTARLSQSSGEGRHTTVNSVMWSLEGGGTVIDSPGVRDYAPAIDAAERVAWGFREIAALADECRFANCRHMREPDCAVKEAVASETISHRRYESYRRLFILADDAAQSNRG